MSGARERWWRFCRLGWERRWGPGAKIEVDEAEREIMGDAMVAVQQCCIAVVHGVWARVLCLQGKV